METLISVDKALQLITEHTRPLEPVVKDLSEACNYVVALDIYAPIDIPAFPQSSMDGYSFAYEEGITDYLIQGEIAAGHSSNFQLPKGAAARIFTGAPVPTGADTVVMQEKVSASAGVLKVLDENLKRGNNVRPVGAEMKKGQLAITKGTVLNPISIGFLAGLGIEKVNVYPKPSVGILVTGNELQKPGNKLSYGQVYDSNSYSLQAALFQSGIKEVTILQSTDNIEQLTKQLALLLEKSDLVLMVGGVSVGDYDFTLKAFEHCGVNPIFHKIKQRPGKPLLFGLKEEKLVFGLPGNPASVLTCFFEYLLPAIGIMAKIDMSVKTINAPLEKMVSKPKTLTCFLKAQYNGASVFVLEGQESYKLSSFANANCLVMIPEGIETMNAGDIVSIHILP